MRRRRGQPIGSGPVGGPTEQALNRRLRQTGARGRVGPVGPFVESGALADSPEWAASWNAA